MENLLEIYPNEEMCEILMNPSYSYRGSDTFYDYIKKYVQEQKKNLPKTATKDEKEKIKNEARIAAVKELGKEHTT